MTAIDTQEVLHLLNRRRFFVGSAALAAVSLMPWKALAQSAAPHSFTQGDIAGHRIQRRPTYAAAQRHRDGRVARATRGSL